MNKLEQAARQALDMMEFAAKYPGVKSNSANLTEVSQALREALAEQSYDKAHGISSYHLQETDQAEQGTVALHKVVSDHIADLRACVPTLQQYPELASTMREVNKAADELESALNSEQAEQKPVGYLFDQAATEVNGWVKQVNVFCSVDPTLVPLKDACNVRPVYAAPVRTNDLTLEEIYSLWPDEVFVFSQESEEFARAVIAADREKNK